MYRAALPKKYKRLFILIGLCAAIAAVCSILYIFLYVFISAYGVGVVRIVDNYMNNI